MLPLKDLAYSGREGSVVVWITPSICGLCLRGGLHYSFVMCPWLHGKDGTLSQCAPLRTWKVTWRWFGLHLVSHFKSHGCTPIFQEARVLWKHKENTAWEIMEDFRIKMSADNCVGKPSLLSWVRLPWKYSDHVVAFQLVVLFHVYFCLFLFLCLGLRT